MVVAAAAAVGLRVMHASSARGRYAFLWAALFLVAVLPLIPPVIALFAVDSASLLPPLPGTPLMTMAFASWSTLAPTALWAGWSVAQTIRLIVAVAAVRAARRQSRVCPDDRLQRLPHWPRVCSGGRTVGIVLSTRVRAAAVLGCGPPLIALAPTLLDELDDDDLDRVLIHEWAHVQRRDDLAQLLEQVVRVAVGWHPAAWWLQRRLSFEREAACDELTVASTGSARAYAVCLTTIASLRHRPRGEVATLAAVSDAGLRQRVVRLLRAPVVPPAPRTRAAMALSCVSLAVVAGVTSSLAVVNRSAGSSALPTDARAILARTMAPLALPARGWRRSATAESPSVPDRSAAAASIAVPRRGPVAHDVSRAMISPPTVTPPAVLLPETAVSDPAAPLDGAAAAVFLVPLSAAVASGMNAAAGPGSARASLERRETGGSGGSAAAQAGTAIGRATQQAGLATAELFTRVGRKVARSF
jgi:beta-lactamase regulating signal transducer with metallopeptidase domain